MEDFSDFEYEDDETAEELDSFDSYDDFGDDDTPEGGNDNRTFWLVAGILGAVLVLALVCMAVYAMVILPNRRDAQSTQAAQINIQNTEMAAAAEMTAQAIAWTPTPTITETPEPVSPTPSRTPVVAPTDTPEGGTESTSEATADPRTATVSALLTQQAGGTATPTPTGLPDTGFADDFGIPGMIALAAALVVVIFLARRLRTANS